VIGNDIVDLNLLDAPPYQHIAHLERVCTSAEARLVHDSDNPSLALSALWAAKEAAYKLISKRETCRRFVPKQFGVQFRNPIALDKDNQAFVTHFTGPCMNVDISVTGLWLHAIAIFQGSQVVRWSVREATRCLLRGRHAQDESEAVRFLAAEVISKYCPQEVALEFRGRRPMLSLKNGSSSAFDVSFSHHGMFAAVAIVLPGCDDRQIKPVGGLPRYASLWEEACCTCTA